MPLSIPLPPTIHRSIGGGCGLFIGLLSANSCDSLNWTLLRKSTVEMTEWRTFHIHFKFSEYSCSWKKTSITRIKPTNEGKFAEETEEEMNNVVSWKEGEMKKTPPDGENGFWITVLSAWIRDIKDE